MILARLCAYAFDRFKRYPGILIEFLQDSPGECRLK
jgi:hypothetical protein